MSWASAGSGEKWWSCRWYQWEFLTTWNHAGYPRTPRLGRSDLIAVTLGDRLFSEVVDPGLQANQGSVSGIERSGDPIGKPARMGEVRSGQKTCFEKPEGNWKLVAGIKYLVSSIWYQVGRTKKQEPRSKNEDSKVSA